MSAATLETNSLGPGWFAGAGLPWWIWPGFHSSSEDYTVPPRGAPGHT